MNRLNSRGLSQISNHSLTSHGSHLMGQKTKRKSTTYDIGQGLSITYAVSFA